VIGLGLADLRAAREQLTVDLVQLVVADRPQPARLPAFEHPQRGPGELPVAVDPRERQLLLFIGVADAQTLAPALRSHLRSRISCGPSIIGAPPSTRSTNASGERSTPSKVSTAQCEGGPE